MACLKVQILHIAINMADYIGGQRLWNSHTNATAMALLMMLVANSLWDTAEAFAPRVGISQELGSGLL
jgi:hypothetical protein